jgi:HSP20 family protein
MTLYISPSRRLASLRQAMDRMFEEEFDNAPSEREMMLALDVLAEDEAYTVRALVPGLEADDLEIEILNNTVAIRGEFKAQASENAKFLMNELPAGRFARVITLPTPLDPAKTEASIKNGVLVLRVPKAEAHLPKAIKVIAAG